MAVVPTNNLPPESQPWARDRDAAIAQLQFDALKAKQDNDNAFLGLNNSFTALTKQVAEIAAATAAAAAAAAAAATASSQALSAANDAAAAAATANAAINNLVTGSTGTNSASPTLNTTPTGYAGITFTVPAGYTRANVMAVSSMYMGGTVASILRTQIAGNNSADTYAFTNAAYANAGSSHALSLTGLSGGGTFVVQAVANTTTSTTSGVILTSASVIWLK